jgi:hypothetical protein
MTVKQGVSFGRIAVDLNSVLLTNGIQAGTEIEKRNRKAEILIHKARLYNFAADLIYAGLQEY